MAFCPQLTRAGRGVALAAAGRPVLEVVIAVVGPQAAVVEAEHVIHPVRLPGHTGRLPERRGAPVVSPVRGAAADGVAGQDLSAVVVVATLLARA